MHSSAAEEEDEESLSADYEDYDRPVFVVYDWKMFGSRSAVDAFAKRINYASVQFKPYVELIVSPPTLYLHRMRRALKSRINVAAQNCCAEAEGAFTGEISATMLENLGVSVVTVGHWDRRLRCGEDDDVVADKLRRVTSVKEMTALACFGDTAEDKAQKKSFQAIVTQLRSITPAVTDWANVILVYEPIWSFPDAAEIETEVSFPEVSVNENRAEEDEDGMTGDINANNDDEEDEDDDDAALHKVVNQSIDDDQFHSSSSNPSTSTFHLWLRETDDLLGAVRRWLKENVSKGAGVMTPILVAGDVTEETCEMMLTSTENVDGFVIPKSTEVDDEEDFEKLISIVKRCEIVADQKPSFA